MILKTETIDNINIILSLKNEIYLIELELLESDNKNNVISKEVVERHTVSKLKIEDAFKRVEMISNTLGEKNLTWEDLENMTDEKELKDI